MGTKSQLLKNSNEIKLFYLRSSPKKRKLIRNEQKVRKCQNVLKMAEIMLKKAYSQKFFNNLFVGEF